MVREHVALHQDLEFDPLTGDVVEEAELSLRSATGDGDADDVADEVVSDLCESFLDVESGQAYAVRQLLYGTLGEARSEVITDDYVDASRDVAAMVELNGPSFDGVPFFVDGERNPEWEAVDDERTALTDEYWHSHHAELVELREEISEVSREMLEVVYTDETVRSAQDLFVERCDIDVPEGFEFPDAEELGITL